MNKNKSNRSKRTDTTNKKTTRKKSEKDVWNKTQQKALEAALASCATTFDINKSRKEEETFIQYWNAVAKQVSGKGAAQCLQQYQSLRQMLRDIQNKSATTTTTGSTGGKLLITPSQILRKQSPSTKPTATKTAKTAKTTTPKIAAQPTPTPKVAKKEIKVAPTVSAPTAPVVAPALAPTPPTPWTPEEHHQLENALKEFQSVPDKREKWRLIASKVPTRKASQCLIKYKQMRKALMESESAEH